MNFKMVSMTIDENVKNWNRSECSMITLSLKQRKYNMKYRENIAVQ